MQHFIFFFWWKCFSTPFGTFVPMGTLFWQPEEISEPPGCQRKYQRIIYGPTSIEFKMHISGWQTSRPGKREYIFLERY
jgi:hypothetical protein